MQYMFVLERCIAGKTFQINNDWSYTVQFFTSPILRHFTDQSTRGALNYGDTSASLRGQAMGLQDRGGARNFPTGGLTLPTRGLNYGFQGIVNAKNIRQNGFSPSDRGASMFRQGAIAPSSPPLVPPLLREKIPRSHNGKIYLVFTTVVWQVG